MTYNIRGLGTSAKQSGLKKLVTNQQIDILMVQETKLPTIDEGFCRKIWHSDHLSFAQFEARGRSGGILTIWDTNKFSVSEIKVGTGYVFIRGLWGHQHQPCVFINIYAPCTVPERKELWSEITAIINTLDCSICICGDFNCMLRTSERRSRNPSFPGMDDFNQFVVTNDLLDLPLANRKFTWHSPNGAVRTRLDRFLLNSKMVSLLRNCKQLAIQRGMSDHCAVILKPVSSDWGAKPFRTLNS